jgi:hypothetical protein
MRERVAQRAIGFPIGPLNCWDPYFWYYGGCKGTRIEPAKPGWINGGDPILTFHYHSPTALFGGGGGPQTLVIRSPFSGVVLTSVLRKQESVNYGYKSWAGGDDRQFVVARLSVDYVMSEAIPLRHHSIGFAYEPLRDEIFGIVDTSTFFGSKPTDSGLRRLDPKRHFETREALLKKADELRDVQAVWLPDTDIPA